MSPRDDEVVAAPLRLNAFCLLVAPTLLAGTLGGCGDDSGLMVPDDSTGGVSDTESPTTAVPTTTGVSATTNVSTTTNDSATTVVDTTVDDSSSSDDSSEAVCGNGTIETGENCDDGNASDGDGCSAACLIDEGWYCDGAVPSVCTTICGDSIIGAPAESCEDGNDVNTDDCTNECQVAVCGDGILWDGVEVCDDGGTDAGDGCDATCAIEAGFACPDSLGACFPAIFLADGSGATSGSLYAVSLDGTTSSVLGAIGVGVTGMAFDPEGVLYAVTATAGASASQLGTIDTQTGAFTVVGSLLEADGTAHNQMPDITFLGDQLVGWTESADDIVLIDSATGTVTPVATERSSFGTGLAYDSAADQLYVAPAGSGGILYLVDEFGVVAEGPVLGGVGGVVKGMAYADGVMYGMDTDNGAGASGDVVTINTGTGSMTSLATLPSPSIDALAVYDSNNGAP